MSDVNVQEEIKSEVAIAPTRTPFDEDYGMPPIEEVKGEVENKETEKKKDENAETSTSNTNTDVSTSIEIPKDWLKKEFDIDDPAILKAEREELKTLKANPPKAEEIKFANEESKQVFELFKEGKIKEVKAIYDLQEQLENVSTLTVDKDNAADIIKLQMKFKNKELTAAEIEFEYKQNFVAPKEPVQKSIETDEEFEERMNEWKEQVQNTEMKMVIAAKMAQPELAKLKTEIVLPEISAKEKQQQENEPTQEDLEALNKAKASFLQSAEQSINEGKGVTVQVKDKDVDYTISYAHSTEEKNMLNSKLKEFAESNFNANVLLAERWVNADGKTINVNQITEDMLRIFGGSKIDQKLATDSANKRLEAYLKDKKQINVNEQTQTGNLYLNKDGLSEMDQVREQAFAV